ncbi:signal peptidase I [Crystallibacter degradans]|uniref:signal peptidase I n=1 Tax=Crystallibacter degradans TaxID=2726743 RepID=UPI001474238F|nr:signal peptidase I [Arthrobacter sp. SF27]NMR30390.1 signal peptidase I [Arthrobacter sp. SF27]
MTATYVEAKPHQIKHFLGKAIGFVALCLALLAAGTLIVIPAATGSQPYTVLTNSMAPKYPPGTLMIVKPADFGSLRLGDVITYQLDSGKPEVITHRIVSVGANQEGDRTLITKGDSNSVEDEVPVQEVQVRGKLLYAVPYVGWVSNWMESGNRDGLVKWLAVGLIAYGMYSIARGTRDSRRKKKAS